MIYRRSVLESILVLIVLTALYGCAQHEQVVTAVQVLPDTYTEQMVPDALAGAMKESLGSNIQWMRCIDCKLDWDGLKSHLGRRLNSRSYRETTDQWDTGFMREYGLASSEYDKFLCVYSSGSNRCHLIVMNLAYARSKGGKPGTQGDFFIVAYQR